MSKQIMYKICKWRSGAPLLEERYCPQLTHTIWQVSMAVLLENVTNCVWQAFASLQQDKTGLVPKSKLKVRLLLLKPSYWIVSVDFWRFRIIFSKKTRQVLLRSCLPNIESESVLCSFYSFIYGICDNCVSRLMHYALTTK